MEGGVVGGRFRIEGLVDAGGMGTIYRATVIDTGERVALKMLQRPDERALQRFELEAQALAALAHPGVVRYVAHGTTADIAPYLVMEWVDGGDLSRVLATRGLSMQDALALAARMLDVLAYVHARGVVHRDLKPSNVMVPDGKVEEAKLVDFGIARILASRGVTATGVRVGTLEYMAPEQIRSARHVDGRADVFALGCILFEALTGRRTFDEETDVQILSRIVLEDAPRVREARPDVPMPLDDFVAQLHARDPAQRPTAAEARAALERVVRALGAADLPPLSSRDLVAADSTVLSAPAQELVRLAQRVASDVAFARTSASEPPSALAIPESVAAPSLPASALPPLVGPTYGRDDEVRDVVARLRASAEPIVLWGAAGVGKTRLAIEVARARAAD